MKYSNNKKSIIMGYILSNADNASKNGIKDTPLVLLHTENYFNFLLNTRKQSLFTIVNVRSTLSSFISFCLKIKNIPHNLFTFSDITKDIVVEWLNYESDTHKIDASSRNQYLHRIKSFMEYATYEINPLIGYNYINIYSIHDINTVKRIGEILSENQVVLIIKKAKEYGGLNAERNAIMLCILYESMVRVSELCNLKLEDAIFRKSNILNNDKEENNQICTLHIFGKGKKHRKIELNKDASDILKKYIEKYHNEHEKNLPLFYCKRDGLIKYLTTRTVQKILKISSDKAREEDNSIPKSVHPLMFRRSKATSIFQHGVPIEIVSSLIGHASVETTRNYYAKPSSEQLADALNKAHATPDSAEHIDRRADEHDLRQVLNRAGLRLRD